MLIRLLTDTGGNVTGFISHIKCPWRHPVGSLIEFPRKDYKILFYYLLGKNNVKVKGGVGSVKIGGLSLKDEGDYNKQHEKLQKDIFKHKPNHLLN